MSPASNQASLPKSGKHVRTFGRVLLVGCGEIGSRHLQAAAALEGVREIEIIDPRPDVQRFGEIRLAELSARNSKIQYRWFHELKDVTADGDLAIVATQAEGRRAVVQAVAEKGYKSFLLEKVVEQSTQAYDSLLDLQTLKNLSIWVNCKARTFPFHQRALSRFDSNEPITFSVTAGNHGLANCGVHNLDLFVFYDRTAELTCTDAQIDPLLHASKRGPHVFDLSGSISAVSPKGSRFFMAFAADHKAPDCYTITSRRYRTVFDMNSRWAFEADEAGGWAWRPVPFEGNLLISEMSKGFIRDILQKGSCGLPTLADCRPAHALLLDALQPHFSRLMGKKLDRCPVT